MTTEETIKKAIEGGFAPGLVTDFSLLTEEAWEMVIHQAGFQYSWGEWTLDRSIFLDPAFWQCLGKAKGWEWECTYCGANFDRKVKHSDGGALIPGANRMWHRFIDHLDERKSIDSFFSNL